MVWVYYITLILTLIAGMLLTVLTLPGLWLMAGMLGLFGWVTGWDRLVGWPSVVLMVALAFIGEIIEFVAGSAGAKKAGGGFWGGIGALLGGIIGAIFLTGLIPIPVLGTIIGLCLGCFLGALGTELLMGKELKQSLLIGAGAAKGRFYAILIKTSIGVVMVLIALWAAFPLL